MPSATLHIGLPLRGVVREGPRVLPGPAAFSDWSAFDIDGFLLEASRRLRPWPGLGAYGDTANAERVTRLVNVLWGDGAADVFRHSETGIFRLSGGSWASLKGALDVDAESPLYWGSALVPGGTGQKGIYLFSTHHRNTTPTDQVFFWNGAAASISATWTAGTPNPGRHVLSFADRGWILDQVVSGTREGRRAQWSIAGDGTSWTGTGSGHRYFTELEGVIKGALANSNSMYVFGNQGIMEGIESFDVDNPVYFEPLTTSGIGLWATNSAIVHQESVYFLSEKGFRSLGPDGIRPIGDAIDSFIIKNIQRDALDSVCVAFVPAPWNMIVWALPMSSSGLPSELWAYEVDRGRWHRTKSLFSLEAAPTALGLVTLAPGVTWDSLVGTWDAQVGSWDSLGGTATRPLLVSGHADGGTRVVEDNTINSGLEVSIETDEWTYEGTLLLGASRGVSSSATRIRQRDVVTLDGILIDYVPFDSSANSELYALASTDGGKNWTHIGTVTLTAAPVDTLKQAEAGLRYSGPRPRLKLTNRHPSTGAVSSLRSTLEDLTISVRRSGSVRWAS